MLVCAATCAMSTLVADDAIDAMLWCSAYQTRWYPRASARRARATLLSNASAAVCPLPMIARSRIDNGIDNGIDGRLVTRSSMPGRG